MYGKTPTHLFSGRRYVFYTLLHQVLLFLLLSLTSIGRNLALRPDSYENEMNVKMSYTYPPNAPILITIRPSHAFRHFGPWFII